MSGTLYIVATPIGNLEDLTLRAKRILSEVSAIACEDTRVTRHLLTRYEISKPLFALHEHSGPGHLNRVLDELIEGRDVAYVSDAGTPGVNDPGGKLVALVSAHHLPIVPIPGPSALTAAISVCGFPMDEFVYLGFVPHKKGRETFFREIAEREMPTVFFESTHRIQKMFDGLAKYLDPMRQLFCGRELTKMHETLYRGTLDEVRQSLQAGSLKGEYVIVIGPKKALEGKAAPHVSS